VREVTAANFGFLVAYVLPGFTTLWGVSYFSETVNGWLGASQGDAPTVGGFLYITLAAVSAGMTVSTVRWLLVDSFHALTGLRHPAWDFSKLQQNVAAYDVLVKIHYHFYQFHSNMLVAITFLYVCRWVAFGWGSFASVWDDLGFILLATIFFMGSRDNLHKYYFRVAAILGTEPSDGPSADRQQTGPARRRVRNTDRQESSENSP